MTDDRPEPDATVTASSMHPASLAGVHFIVWLLSFALFAAADSWRMLTGFGIAAALSIVSAAIAGLVTTTLAHEWFHLLGARLSGGRYTMARKPGLFVFDWDFPCNSVSQFYTMSVAGSVGGAVGIMLLWSWVPTDTAGRAALLAGGIASFFFAAVIEWPVLRRTRVSGAPLAELSKVDRGVLLRGLLYSTAAGLLAWLVIT